MNYNTCTVRPNSHIPLEKGRELLMYSLESKYMFRTDAQPMSGCITGWSASRATVSDNVAELRGVNRAKVPHD